VSRKKIVHITEAVVTGDLDKIVEDRTVVKKIILKYKTDDHVNWAESHIEYFEQYFKLTVEIPDFCKVYQFKIIFEGSVLTLPVELSLDTTLGPADLESTGLEYVPSVTQLGVFSSMKAAQVEWKQPACVSGYKFALFNLEDCSDEEEFEDCFVDFGLDTIGYQNEGQLVKMVLPNLESCMEYVFMVRTFNSYGESRLVTQKFRTRETNNTDIDLDNFGQVGAHIPSLMQMSMTSGVESAVITWRQPECFPEYELQIVALAKCEDRQMENCARDFSPDVYDIADSYEHSHQFDILDIDTEYVVMGRSTGDVADGAVVAHTFNTLPGMSSSL